MKDWCVRTVLGPYHADAESQSGPRELAVLGVLILHMQNLSQVLGVSIKKLLLQRRLLVSKRVYACCPISTHGHHLPFLKFNLKYREKGLFVMCSTRLIQEVILGRTNTSSDHVPKSIFRVLTDVRLGGLHN